MKKGVVRFHVLRLINGGLDWNRTSDTRIFNCSTRRKLSIYGGYKRIACYVLCIVLSTNHRNPLHVFILSASKIAPSTDFLESAGAVKILLLFSAPANLLKIELGYQNQSKYSSKILIFNTYSLFFKQS